MRLPTIFHLISSLSNKAGIDCVLIGGFALNQHGVSRATQDLDLLTTRENFDKISGQLKKAGFKLDDIKETFARFIGTDYYLLDVDFMFVDKATLDKILSDSKEVTILDQRFKVPSLDTLIALKLHAIKNNQKLREVKDLPDIISLVRANNVDVKNDKFRDLCLKFGNQDIYDKIVGMA